MITPTKYTEDGYPVYQATGLYVTLYDDYLLMEGGNLTSVTSTRINYKDIISISYSNGGTVGASFIEFNTAGKAYRYSPNIDGVKVAGSDNMKLIADAVQDRIDNPEKIDTSANKRQQKINEIDKELSSIQTSGIRWSTASKIVFLGGIGLLLYFLYQMLFAGGTITSIPLLIIVLLFVCLMIYLGRPKKMDQASIDAAKAEYARLIKERERIEKE